MGLSKSVTSPSWQRQHGLSPWGSTPGSMVPALSLGVSRGSLWGAFCSCRRTALARRRSSSDGRVDLILSYCEGFDGSYLTAEGATTTLTDDTLTFGAFSEALEGTRTVSLGCRSFHAFTAPRQNTSQFVVERRLGDVVKESRNQAPHESRSVVFRLRMYDPSTSLTPSRAGPHLDFYRGRPLDRSQWVFWETFWAPAGTDARATFEQELTPSRLWADARCHTRGPDPSQAPTAPLEDGCSKKEAFERIYHQHVWPGIVSRSGPGSDPFHPMARLAITALDIAVDSLGVCSLLDAACGDAGWISAHFLSRRPHLEYFGADVVPHVVNENRRRYPCRKFLLVDLTDTDSSLPCVDLVFSKESLNHMFLADAVRAVMHFQSTRAKYLVCNVTRGSRNLMGAAKGSHANYVHYDYEAPPFNLRRLAQLVEVNCKDRTEFSLFSLQG